MMPVLPARQRFKSEGLPGHRLLRLIVETKLSAFDGGAQRVLQSTPLANLLAYFGVEKQHRAANLRFGAIEGDVRVADQGFTIGTVIGIYRRSDRRPGLDATAFHADFFPKGFQQAIRKRRGYLVAAVHDQCEFIAADPRYKGVTCGAQQAPRYLT